MTVKYNGTTLTKGTDYSLSYSDNIDIGKATVTIKGKGDYTGSVTKTYKIYPKKTGSVELETASKAFTATWKKVSGVTGYQVQCAKNKSFTKGKKTVTVTGAKNTSASVTDLTSSTKYYVRVRTYKTVDGKKYYSEWTSVETVKTMKKYTVFAGDSIMTGLKKSSYNGVSYMTMSGYEKVIARKSLNPYTFQTYEYSDDLTYVDKVISYKPYRLYIMLGTNGIEYLSVDYLIENYEELITYIQEESPTTDIVILPIPPVSKSVASSRTGFKKISKFNKKLEALAEDLGVRYYDFTSAFTNSSGYMLSKYNGGDGIHWSLSGYKKFAALISKYDAKLEE